MVITSSPLISIIIPTYNRDKFILSAIRSAQRQSIEDIEIIVIDDGSDDDTRNIVQNIALTDRRILYFYQRNKGVSDARNNGIDKSKGKYIAFLDSDDLFLPSHIEVLLAAMKNRKDIKVALSNFKFFGMKQETLNNKIAFNRSMNHFLKTAFKQQQQNIWISKDNLLSALLLSGFPFRCPASLINKDLIDSYPIRFDPNISYLEDAHFMTLLSYFCKFAFIDHRSYLVRKHSENANDLKYLSIKYNSYEKRVLSTIDFFKDRPLSRAQKEALKFFIWENQGCVSFERSKNLNFFFRIKECLYLLLKVFSFRSFKTCLKIILKFETF